MLNNRNFSVIWWVQRKVNNVGNIFHSEILFFRSFEILVVYPLLRNHWRIQGRDPAPPNGTQSFLIFALLLKSARVTTGRRTPNGKFWIRNWQPHVSNPKIQQKTKSRCPRSIASRLLYTFTVVHIFCMILLNGSACLNGNVHNTAPDVLFTYIYKDILFTWGTMYCWPVSHLIEVSHEWINQPVLNTDVLMAKWVQHKTKILQRLVSMG